MEIQTKRISPTKAQFNLQNAKLNARIAPARVDVAGKLMIN